MRMKPTATFPTVPCRAFCLSGLLALLLAFSARAQFPATAAQTLFVCNAPGI